MLQKIFGQAPKDRKVCLVKEGPIYFLVLNTKQNEADLETIIQFGECLDEVANAPGQAVLVTVSSSPKFFSTGFSLNYFA